jgi:signal transduction histidine kinase
VPREARAEAGPPVNPPTVSTPAPRKGGPAGPLPPPAGRRAPGAGRRRGLQAEVLASLTLVMITGTGLLAALLIRTHEDHLGQLQQLAVRGLVAELRAPRTGLPAVPGMRWWTLAPDGEVLLSTPFGAPIDAASRELAEAALSEGRPVLQSGRIWQPIRLATPQGVGEVVVAWLPPAASAALVSAMVVGVIAVFTAFGLYLLRGRLVVPLQQLAAGVRQVADGRLDARLPVDGVAETADVAAAFNEMSEALASRTEALEKAVDDLRDSNRSLREARAGLDRAERLAAVGRLAAGVAHEVGNPMGALLAFLDLAGRDPGLSDAGRQHLDKAAVQGQRVRLILRGLLDFSRPQRARPEPVDVGRVCDEAADLIRAQRRYAGLEVAVSVEGTPPPAHADPGGVAQIVLNLLLNAADALASPSRPTATQRIEVRIRPVALSTRPGDAPDAAEARARFDAVECRVCDTGPGIAPEDRERIFDPFFSTKEPGQGTGLGLSNAVRLAEQFGGSLVLDEAHAPGAAFVLRLPAAPADGAGAVRSSARA